MWDETSYLTTLLGSTNEDHQHICNDIELDRRHWIPLPQSLLCLEIMTYNIINLGPDTTRLYKGFDLLPPDRIKTLLMQILLQKWPITLIIRLFKIHF